MFEKPVTYPCASAENTDEGRRLAVEWVLKKSKTEESEVTIWAHSKTSLKGVSHVESLSFREGIEVVTPRTFGRYPSGVALALWPDIDSIGHVISGTGIKALCIVQSIGELETWVDETGSEILFETGGYVNEMPEPPLCSELVEALETITNAINHNNRADQYYNKQRIVTELRRCRDLGINLQEKRIAQWAAAHGWTDDNPKILRQFVSGINRGARFRLTN